ncbi:MULTISPECIES: DUF896 domain-containing protein [Cohnella]|jgi:uncharacterized protein YnzC (UPF0291/DUF896 family)|uniref:DUF896 domain-containing protein n=1 Tax=Cohnella TaxID=329857 RepID=UPI000E3A1DCE|nr:DUF896 domain-containing protein [Cohnella sp.]REK68690.1 MAG: DUF896 family protein [Cohnella sp.]
MQKLIARINELSRKHKTVGLTDDEKAEREELRRQYLSNIRQQFRQQLDSIEWVDEPPRQSIKH